MTKHDIDVYRASRDYWLAIMFDASQSPPVRAMAESKSSRLHNLILTAISRGEYNDG